MSFLDASTLNNKTLATGFTGVSVAQNMLQRFMPNTSSVVNSALSKTVGTTAGTGVGAVSGAVKTVENTASSYIKSALSSLGGVFSSVDTSLASGINSQTSSLFSNTNNAAGSDTNTKVPDPINSNFAGKNVKSGIFSVSSLNKGSTATSLTGATTANTTGASTMTGTQLSTVLGRYNLDSSSASSLTSSIAGYENAQGTNSLFTNLLGATATQAANTESTVVSSDLSTFLGKTGNLAQLTTGSATGLESMFSNTTNQLIDSSGNVVSTSGSGVSAAAASAVSNVAYTAGCGNGGIYTSYGGQMSLYNVATQLASSMGLSSLLTDLLGCSAANSILGQGSLSEAFTNNSPSAIGIAESLLSGIQAKTALNTPAVTTGIVTNPNLTAADTGTVATVMNGLGTTTQAAYTVPSVSSTSLPVYDTAILSAAQSSFTNAVFGDSTLTSAINGQTLTTDASGAYVTTP